VITFKRPIQSRWDFNKKFESKKRSVMNRLDNYYLVRKLPNFGSRKGRTWAR